MQKIVTSRLFVLVLAIPITTFLFVIFALNPEYLINPDENGYPDAKDYLLLGKNLAEHGVFSRTSGLDPDMLRTPMYPILIAITHGYLRPYLLYFSQALAFLASIWLLRLIAIRWIDATNAAKDGKAIQTSPATKAIGTLTASFAAVLMSTDLMLVKMCFEAMSEIFFLFSLICFLYLLGWPRTPFQNSPTHFQLVTSGIALGISVLIRPTLLYLPPLIAGGTILTSLKSRTQSFRDLSLGLLLFCLTIVVVVLPWMIRNHRVFEIIKLSTVDTHNLIYFVGAGPYQLREGVDRQEAQAMISQKYRLPTYSELQNPHTVTRSIKELEDSAERAKWSIVLEDPPRLAVSSAIGMIKGLFSHANGPIASILGEKWIPPGFSGLIQLNPQSWGTLKNNGIVLAVTFLWQYVHLATLYLFAIAGFVICMRDRRQFGQLMSISIVLAYGLLMIMPFGLDAVYRSRIVCLPVLYLLAGRGIAETFLKYRNRSSPSHSLEWTQKCQ